MAEAGGNRACHFVFVLGRGAGDSWRGDSGVWEELSRTGFSLSGFDCHAVRKADRLKPVLLRGALRLLDEFDQHFLVVPRSHQEKIHAGAIRSGARRGIDRLNFESCAQDFRGAVHVGHINLHLLNSFAKFFEETGDGAVAAGRFRRQDVQADVRQAALCKFELEFQNILVGGRVAERRRAVGGTDLIKGFRQDGDSDSESWRQMGPRD